MRLFIAITLPEATRAALHAAAQPLRERDAPVRWVAEDALHITLKFLGHVADGREPSVIDALDTVSRGRQGFALPLEGFGAFPTASRPRVFWTGCEAEPALELLQHDVERAMDTLGFAVEARTFRPHVTLGRTRKGRERDAAGLEDLLAGLAFTDTVSVDSVALMESRLHRSGARYTVRHRATLEGG